MVYGLFEEVKYMRQWNVVKYNPVNVPDSEHYIGVEETGSILGVVEPAQLICKVESEEIAELIAKVPKTENAKNEIELDLENLYILNRPEDKERIKALEWVLRLLEGKE